MVKRKENFINDIMILINELMVYKNILSNEIYECFNANIFTL